MTTTLDAPTGTPDWLSMDEPALNDEEQNSFETGQLLDAADLDHLYRFGSLLTGLGLDSPDADDYTGQQPGEKAITPGGRVGDDSPFSDSHTSNWVARAGGLPTYIREVAHAMVRKGRDVSEAIRLAVGIVRNWAEGKGNVTAKVRAAAGAAIADWEKKRGEAHAKVTPGTETKGGSMSTATLERPTIERKALSFDGGIGQHVEAKVVDETTGVVEAIVSVTGVVDKVNDIIEPGAYEKTLAARRPKGVWSHDWNTPVAKALDVVELMPGDPRLPTETGDGTPWPVEAGGLLVKMQFNLGTEDGRKAFSNVVFFGPEAQWSIGYNVPVGGSKNDRTGIRRIKTLDLYEFSPVLFGAAPQTVTSSVKSLLDAAESGGVEVKDLAAYGLDVKRDYTTAERVAMAKNGEAIPIKNADDEVVGGAFPIKDTEDLDAAIHSFGRSKPEERAKVRAHIRARAKDLGEKVPDLGEPDDDAGTKDVYGTSGGTVSPGGLNDGSGGKGVHCPSNPKHKGVVMEEGEARCAECGAPMTAEKALLGVGGFETLPGTYEEVTNAVSEAVRDAVLSGFTGDRLDRPWVEIIGTYPDRVVYIVHNVDGSADQAYQCDYTVSDPDNDDDIDDVDLGDPQEVDLSVSVRVEAKANPRRRDGAWMNSMGGSLQSGEGDTGSTFTSSAGEVTPNVIPNAPAQAPGPIDYVTGPDLGATVAPTDDGQFAVRDADGKILATKPSEDEANEFRDTWNTVSGGGAKTLPTPPAEAPRVTVALDTLIPDMASLREVARTV